MRIGVYMCRAGGDDGDGVNLESVGHYVANLPQVEVGAVARRHAQARPGGARRRDRRRATRPDRDRRRLARLLQAGVHAAPWRSPAANPTRCGWPRSASTAPSGDGATERAKAIVACAVFGVPFPLAARPRTRSAPPPRSSSAAASPASRPRSRSPTPASRSTWSSARAPSAATWRCSTRPSPPSTAPPASSRRRWWPSASTR